LEGRCPNELFFAMNVKEDRVKLYIYVFFLFFSLPLFAVDEAEKPVEFCFVICSYNNSKWCERNLETVFSQTYPHWTIYYTDDCSTDGTGEKVENYVKFREMSHKCKIVRNETRKGAMANFYTAIHTLPPKTVVVAYDGDDFLINSSVLKILERIYQNPNVWITYGSDLRTSTGKRGPNCRPFPDNVIKNRTFRKHRWCTDHLRTFYAALFNRIRKKDLMYKNDFFSIGSDVAYFMPMLEMASQGHIRYVRELLCIYNDTNPLNDMRTRRQFSNMAHDYICAQPPYRPLKRLF